MIKLDDVDLYYLCLNDFNKDDLLTIEYSKLPKYRQEKIDKFTCEREKFLSILAGMILHQACLDNEILDYENDIIYINNGKPDFNNQCGYHFNISHSNNYCILAISKKVIGCDIEEIKNDKISIAKKYFFEDEISYIDKSLNKKEAFYEIWTKKESFIKYTGEGLKRGLSSFSVISKSGIKEDIDFSAVDIIPGYKIAICKEKSKAAN